MSESIKKRKRRIDDEDAEEAEIDKVAETGGEFAAETEFGSIRFDGHNEAEQQQHQQRNRIDAAKSGAIVAAKADFRKVPSNAESSQDFLLEDAEAEFTKPREIVVGKSGNKIKKKKLTFASPDFSFRPALRIEKDTGEDSRTLEPTFEGHDEDNLNYIDEVYFQQLKDAPAIDVRVPVNEDELIKAQKLVKSSTQDLNFIDSQLFPQNCTESLKVFTDERRKSTAKGHEITKSKSVEEGKNTVNLTSKYTQQLKDAPGVDVKVRVDEDELVKAQKLVKASTKDLNFIDSQLFPQNHSESSKLFTDERRKLTAKGREMTKSKSVKEGKKSKKPNNDDDKLNEGRPKSALQFIKRWRESRKTDLNEGQKGKLAVEKEVDLLGVGIQKRLASVYSANLREKDQEALSKMRTGEKRTGGFLPSEMEHLRNTRLDESLKAPKLSTLTSVELEEILSQRIVYNDNDVLALNKPYGVSMFDDGVHSLDKYLPFLAGHAGCERLFMVHRLDKTTSGVILFAKTERMQSELKRLFKERKVDKRYWAVVRGVPAPDAGIIDIAVGPATLKVEYYILGILGYLVNSN